MYITHQRVVNMRVTPREFHPTVGMSEIFVAVAAFTLSRGGDGCGGLDALS